LPDLVSDCRPPTAVGPAPSRSDLDDPIDSADEEEAGGTSQAKDADFQVHEGEPEGVEEEEQETRQSDESSWEEEEAPPARRSSRCAGTNVSACTVLVVG
jgi:hypothetical protein